jgi:hypothetical protein
MSAKGRPFFNQDTDPSNPNNQEAVRIITEVASSGQKKGESRSIDPLTGRRFPKGFTPPVDFYTDKGPVIEAKEGELSNSEKNNFNQTTAGKDPETGRHYEYGRSITINKGNGLSTRGGGDKYVTEYAGTVNPVIMIKEENLSPFNRILDLNNTDPETGLPIEYGRVIRNTPPEFQESFTSDRLGDRYEVYDNFGSWAKKNFTHLLDFFIEQNGLPVVPKILATNVPINLLQEVYLGTSFIRTFDDNEDPTTLGFEMRFKTDTSPLLNSNIISFIRAFGPSYEEISSREELIYKFREQLYKFIPNDSLSNGGYRRAKSYYVQSISGLDKLVERAGGSDVGYFVDYGKDIITLDFLEDVSQNMGYLSSLYKALSWSRISGKEAIPPNLLKFDLELKITEMKNYSRNAKDPKNPKRILSFTDRISTYYYTLYECQFIFDKLPHGDTVKNNATETLENFKLSFTYKFATLSFAKYDGRVTVNKDGSAKINYFIVNNARKNLLKPKSDETLPSNISLPLFKYPNESTAVQNVNNEPGNGPETNDLATNTIPDDQTEFPETLEDFKQSEREKSALNSSSPEPTDPSRDQLGTNKRYDQIEGGLRNGQLAQVSNQVSIQAALLNRTIKNIIDSRGVGSNIPKENFATKNDSTQLESKGSERSFFQNKVMDNFKRELKNAVVNQINRTIIQRARLLNNAIDDIRNQIPFAGRMSEPTNVYTSTNAFRNDIINSLRNFVGGSIKSFFDKPV